MADLRETVYLESAPSIDADSGEIRGVKLLGMESRNKRRYTKEALAKAVSLYEGRKVYVDHPDRSEVGNDRSINDWAGTIKSARLESDGIYGDVKLRKKSGFFEGIIEAAQEFPNDVGFSHVADGESNFEGETEIVESIREVFSVDLVTDPATTAGFFESKRKAKKRTVKAALESLPEGTVRTRLVEMIDSYGELPMADEKPTDPLSNMAAIIDELIKQLGAALNALASKQETPPPPATPAPAAPEAPEDEMPQEDPKQKEQQAAFESLQKENAELKAKALLLESGREATDVRVKALAAAAEADREALLESWPKTEPEIDERPFRSPPLLESVEADVDCDWINPEKFAARYR